MSTSQKEDSNAPPASEERDILIERLLAQLQQLQTQVPGFVLDESKVKKQIERARDLLKTESTRS